MGYFAGIAVFFALYCTSAPCIFIQPLKGGDLGVLDFIGSAFSHFRILQGLKVHLQH